jgi:hypothetical protein
MQDQRAEDQKIKDARAEDQRRKKDHGWQRQRQVRVPVLDL